MTSNDGTTPAARYVAALTAGKSPDEAHAIAYPTPALFTDNKGSK